MKSTRALVVVLGTGGTIAGTATGSADALSYRAAQLGVDQLVQAVPPLAGTPLECEQVAQIDSKDMDFAVWQALFQRISHHLVRDEVAGVVVTHGTDTLEETAYFLQRVLAPTKPVVLTAAMRPATALQADGPQNLLDAVTVARSAQARGVVAVMAGAVHSAFDVRKAHTLRIDAFDSGDAGPVAWIEAGQLRELRAWPQGAAVRVNLTSDADTWPRVAIVTSHAGADGTLVDAAVAAGLHGLVVAGTGNGTLHASLEAALRRAQGAGVQVLRCSRVAAGPVLAKPEDTLEAGGTLSPVKARVELMLRLLAC